MPVDNGPERDTVQSVMRAFEILEALGAAETAVGIKEIATRISLPMPTIHRLLRTLMASGYVYRTPERRYALGSRVIPLARHAGGVLGTSLVPHLQVAVQTVGESASIAILDQDQARYIAHVPSKRSMRMFTEVGNHAALHATGVGKALLASMDEAEARRVVARTGLPSITSRTITDPQAFRDELSRVQERGYAIDEGEFEIGVRCVALAIPGNLPLAASVSGPEGRMTDEFIEDTCIGALQTLSNSIVATLPRVESL